MVVFAAFAKEPSQSFVDELFGDNPSDHLSQYVEVLKPQQEDESEERQDSGLLDKIKTIMEDIGIFTTFEDFAKQLDGDDENIDHLLTDEERSECPEAANSAQAIKVLKTGVY